MKQMTNEELSDRLQEVALLLSEATVKLTGLSNVANASKYFNKNYLHNEDSSDIRKDLVANTLYKALFNRKNLNTLSEISNDVTYAAKTLESESKKNPKDRIL